MSREAGQLADRPSSIDVAPATLRARPPAAASCCGHARPADSCACAAASYTPATHPRYGNLIIIKHGDTVLSAYAHTWLSRCTKGREVRLGEEIARMGSGGTT